MLKYETKLTLYVCEQEGVKHGEPYQPIPDPVTLDLTKVHLKRENPLFSIQVGTIWADIKRSDIQYWICRPYLFELRTWMNGQIRIYENLVDALREIGLQFIPHRMRGFFLMMWEQKYGYICRISHVRPQEMFRSLPQLVETFVVWTGGSAYLGVQADRTSKLLFSCEDQGIKFEVYSNSRDPIIPGMSSVRSDDPAVLLGSYRLPSSLIAQYQKLEGLSVPGSGVHIDRETGAVEETRSSFDPFFQMGPYALNDFRDSQIVILGSPGFKFPTAKCVALDKDVLDNLCVLQIEDNVKAGVIYEPQALWTSVPTVEEFGNSVAAEPLIPSRFANPPANASWYQRPPKKKAKLMLIWVDQLASMPEGLCEELVKYYHVICCDKYPPPGCSRLAEGYFMDTETFRKLSDKRVFNSQYLCTDLRCVNSKCARIIAEKEKFHFLKYSQSFITLLLFTNNRTKFLRRYEPDNETVFICDTVADYLWWKDDGKKNLFVLTLGQIDPEVREYPPSKCLDVLRTGVIYLYGNGFTKKGPDVLTGELHWDYYFRETRSHYHQYLCCVKPFHVKGLASVCDDEHVQSEKTFLRPEKVSGGKQFWRFGFGPHRWYLAQESIEDLLVSIMEIMEYWDTLPSKALCRKAALVRGDTSLFPRDFWLPGELESFRWAHQDEFDNDAQALAEYSFNDFPPIFNQFKMRRIEYADDAMEITEEHGHQPDIESSKWSHAPQENRQFPWDLNMDIVCIERFTVQPGQMDGEGERHGW